MTKLVYCNACGTAPCECHIIAEKPVTPIEYYHDITVEKDGTYSLCVSYVHRNIIKQFVNDDGKLETHISEEKGYFPAGILICDEYDGRWDEAAAEYEAECYERGEIGHDYILSDTVTRFGVLFIDRGTFTRTID